MRAPKNLTAYCAKINHNGISTYGVIIENDKGEWIRHTGRPGDNCVLKVKEWAKNHYPKAKLVGGPAGNWRYMAAHQLAENAYARALRRKHNREFVEYVKAQIKTTPRKDYIKLR